MNLHDLRWSLYLWLQGRADDRDMLAGEHLRSIVDPQRYAVAPELRVEWACQEADTAGILRERAAMVLRPSTTEVVDAS